MQRNRGVNTLDDEHLKRAAHTGNRFRPVFAAHDQLGNQGIVIWRDHSLSISGSVDANAGTARRIESRDPSGRGRELLRMLSIDAAFDGMATMQNWTVQDIFQALAGGQQNLALHQVHVRDHFSDGMLHLNTRVHLDEVELPVFIHEELYGAGIHVANFRQRLAEHLPDLVAQFRRHLRGWRFLQQFLVPTLNGTFALTQTDHVAILVCQNLEFDVPRALYELLHIEIAIAEGCGSFRRCRFE